MGKPVFGLFILSLLFISSSYSLSTSLINNHKATTIRSLKATFANSADRLYVETDSVDILGNPLIHGEPNFIRAVIREGEEHPDLELKVNREAFDNYIDNLLQGRVHALQHAEWEWLDNIVRESKRIVNSGVQAVKGAATAVVNGVTDAAKAVANGVKSAIDAVHNAYNAIANLASLNTAFRRIRSFVDNIGGILQSFGGIKFWDLLISIIIGIVSGFTMGAAENFITGLLRPSKTGPPPNPLITNMKNTFKAAGEEVAKIFTGLFGDKASRGGLDRLEFLKVQVSKATTAMGNFLASVWTFVSSESFLKPVLGFIKSMLIAAIFTIVLLVIPGLGWFIKLAGMVVTTVLAVLRFVLIIVPRFIKLIAACWDKSACTPAQTGLLVQNVMEVVGMAIAIFLAGKPDQSVGFEGFSKSLSQNPIAKAANLQINPNLYGATQSFKLALSTAISKGPVAMYGVLKDSGLQTAVLGAVGVSSVTGKIIQIERTAAGRN